MNKNYSAYFGHNIARKLYVAACILLVLGAAVAIFYWAGYGIPIAIVGLIMFFVSSGKQISDNDVDEKIIKEAKDFGEKILESQPNICKELQKGNEFSVFHGYIRENGNVRFKSGNDGKIRTSAYFITAIYAKKKDCQIITAYRDLILDNPSKEQKISTKGAENIKLTRTPTQLPQGNFKCELSLTKDGREETFEFFLPKDALADKLLDVITSV